MAWTLLEIALPFACVSPAELAQDLRLIAFATMAEAGSIYSSTFFRHMASTVPEGMNGDKLELCWQSHADDF